MSNLVIPQSVFTRAGLYPRVRSGVFLSFTVRSRGEDGSWRILIGGKELSVFSNLKLEPGKSYRAKVFVTKEMVELRLMQPPRPDAALRESLERSAPGLNARELAVLLSSAGIPVRAASIERFIRLIDRLQSDRFGRRLLSLLLGKGIDPEEGDSFRRLEGLFSGGNREDSEEHLGRHHSEKENQDESRRRKRGSLSGKAVREAVCAKGGQGSLLSLFNHLTVKGENWMLIPLPSAENGGDILEGVLRIRFPPGAYDRIDRATLTIRSRGGSSFHFQFEEPEESRILRVFLPEEILKRVNRGIIDDFRKKLNNLRVQLDDIKSEDLFDGCDFSGNGGISEIDTLV
jgi:hypothetical protein